MNRTLEIIDLGHRKYEPVWEMQKQLQKDRQNGLIDDRLIFVEHDHVYTIGKGGDPNNVIASPAFLTQEGIRVIPIDRGGDVTYHGPGQIVGYPIFDLNQHQPSVTWYMRTLEQVIIDVLGNYSIDAGRIDDLPGVWIGQKKKIAAVGVRISRWVTMHGFALNVKTNLNKYKGIIACGLNDKSVTSIEAELTGEKMPTLEDLKSQLVTAVKKNFNFTATTGVS